MLKNYRTWLTFARDVLDLDVELRDIVLVTGCDMTANWATATFTDRTINAVVSFQAGQAAVGAETSLWGSWQTSVGVPHRCGPQPMHPPSPGEITPLPLVPAFNQCIFIRTYRVHERPMFLPNTIIANAGPHKLDKNYPDAPGSSAHAVNTQQAMDVWDGTADSVNPVVDRVSRRFFWY